MCAVIHTNALEEEEVGLERREQQCLNPVLSDSKRNGILVLITLIDDVGCSAAKGRQADMKTRKKEEEPRRLLTVNRQLPQIIH